MDLEKCILKHIGDGRIKPGSMSSYRDHQEYELSNRRELLVYNKDWKAEAKKQLFIKTGSLLVQTFACGEQTCFEVRKTVSLTRDLREFVLWLAPNLVQFKLISLFENLASQKIFHRDCRASNLAVADDDRFIIIDAEHAETLDPLCDRQDTNTCAARMMLNACYERIEYFDIWDKLRIVACPLWLRACELLFPGDPSAVSSWFPPFLVNQKLANRELLERCRAAQPRTWEILLECHALIACLHPSAHEWIVTPKRDYIWPNMVILVKGQTEKPKSLHASSYHAKKTEQAAWIGLDKDSPDTIEACIQAAVSQKQGKLLGKGSRGSVFELQGATGNSKFVVKVVSIEDQEGMQAWEYEAKKGTEIGLVGLGPVVHKYMTCPKAKAGFIVMDRVRVFDKVVTDAFSYVLDRPNLLEWKIVDGHKKLLTLFTRLAGEGLVDQGGWESIGIGADKNFVLRRVDDTRSFDSTTRRDRDFAVAAMILVRFKIDTPGLRARAVANQLFLIAVALILDVDRDVVFSWSRDELGSRVSKLFNRGEQISNRARSMSVLNQEIVILCLQRLRALLA
jgi:hypothetical protein